MDLKQAFALMTINSGIKPGDTVRVVRKAKSYENGWNAAWNPKMDDAVGKEFVVTDDKYVDPTRYGFTLADYYHYPFFVLEKVKDAKPPFEAKKVKLNNNYTAEVFGDRVEVGCQIIPFAAIKELALAVKAAEEYAKS